MSSAVPLTFQLLVLLLLAESVSAAAALESRAEAGYRVALVRPAGGVKPSGFHSLTAPQTGVYFTNFLDDRFALTNSVLNNGSGVAAGDIDGDGWCDLYFCQLGRPNVLYRNLGNWKFKDITDEAGVGCAGQFSTGGCLADLDGDGDLDLLVNSLGGGTRCFINDGHGHFRDVTAASGLMNQGGSHSLALADVDGDGDLDLYVANYRTTIAKDEDSIEFSLLRKNGRVVVPPKYADRFRIMKTPDGISSVEMGEPDVLYLNDGHGAFKAVPWIGSSFADEEGKPLVEPYRDWGLSAMFRDMNGDGAPDLYVCNDLFSPDRVWMNDGRGHFRLQPPLALRHTAFSAMAVDFADIDRDGKDDFFVVEMLSRRHVQRQSQRSNFENPLVPHWGWPLDIDAIDCRPQVLRNTLYLNWGDASYAEIGELAGVEASEWSWGVAFLDVDLDGYEDLLIANGHAQNAIDSDVLKERSERLRRMPERDAARLMVPWPTLASANVAFRNRGDVTFEEVGEKWGFDTMGVANGMALADLDNDGDLDVVINNLNGVATVLRNETVAPRVAVRLKGAGANTRGIGARIRVTGGPVPQSQEMICGGRYLSGDDTMRVFAAGSRTNRLTIEVAWRSGRRSVVREVEADRIYEIDEAAAALSPATPAAQNPVAPYFVDVSELIQHVHHDEAFDDYARQPLLPRRLGQAGPGVAWMDLDGDGADDLIVSTGRGGRFGVMLNNGQGGFRLVEADEWAGSSPADQTSPVGWAARPGTRTLLVGLSGYEDPTAVTNNILHYETGAAGVETSGGLLAAEVTVGPLAVADLDADGDLDLFVGGQAVPGRYPEASRSRIYRNDGGRFVLDQENSRRLERVGVVNGAVWSDLDGDGRPELVLACEWGPIRVFRNRNGGLEEATEDLGLANHRGWWNGVTTGDLDGDGRMDLIASNWGRNSKYQRCLRDEIRLYHGDLDGNGSWDLVEAWIDPDTRQEVPVRDYRTMGAAMPFILDRISGYRKYGLATLQEILGDHLRNATSLRVNTLDSMVFMNRGARFVGSPLPLPAQFAPAFGVNVVDFDGDGAEDVFLSQNFFAVDRETGRYDGGRGLWLRGDGKGGLRTVPGLESGVLVFGEQRGSAMADYDGDGRVDLVVTQNRAATKLFRNTLARPGLRVRLAGPSGNLSGIGAVIRISHGESLGAAREIHGGAGYWSQDSVVQVMSLSPAQPAPGVWVRWPGGKITTARVPAGAREVEGSVTGAIKAVR